MRNRGFCRAGRKFKGQGAAARRRCHGAASPPCAPSRRGAARRRGRRAACLLRGISARLHLMFGRGLVEARARGCERFRSN
eukprot:4119816-Prymnesium_polylepis.1